MSANHKLLGATQTAQVNPCLEFRDGQHLLRITNLEGGIVERFISNAAVREAFSGIPIDSGWTRPEIARWGDGRHGEWAVAFFSPDVYRLELTDEVASDVPEGAVNEIDVTKAFKLHRITVPLPGLALFGIGTQYHVWAVKTEKLDPYQEIYRCPLPNIYANGAICWGLVKPPRMTARTLFDAWDLFITSTFNNHLANAKSKKHDEDVRVMLREMSSSHADRYPVEDLVKPVEDMGVTLDQAVKEFFATGVMPE